MEAILNFDLAVFKFIQDVFHYGSNAVMDTFMVYYTWLGDGLFWVLVGVALLIPKKTRKIGIAMLLAQLICKGVNGLILKNIFARTRPFALFNIDVAKQCVNGYEYNGAIRYAKRLGGEKYIIQVTEEIGRYSEAFVEKWRSTYYYCLKLYPYSNGFSFPSGHTSSSFSAAGGIFFACKGKKQKTFGIIAIIAAALVGFSRIYLHVHYCTDVLAGAVVGLLCGLVAFFICKKIYPYIEKTIENIKAKITKKEEIKE